MNIREQVIEKIGTILDIPPLTSRVIHLISLPEIDETELTAIIDGEEILQRNIVQFANSSTSKGKKKVTTVRNAVAKLGREDLLRIVITHAFEPVIGGAEKSYDLHPGKLWMHSIAVALTAEEIAYSMEIPCPRHTFTAGLLHDIGKIVIGTLIEIDPLPILGMALRERVSIDVAERQVLGIDHPEGGAMLLEKWGLPEAVVRTVKYHHQPDVIKDNRLTVDLVHVSDALCYVCGIGIKGGFLKLCPSCEAVSRLALTTKASEKAASRAKERFEELTGTFEFSSSY
jgi:putative nucleotidyltransferase with HDIG domain